MNQKCNQGIKVGLQRINLRLDDWSTVRLDKVYRLVNTPMPWTLTDTGYFLFLSKMKRTPFIL